MRRFSNLAVNLEHVPAPAECPGLSRKARNKVVVGPWTREAHATQAWLRDSARSEESLHAEAPGALRRHIPEDRLAICHKIIVTLTESQSSASIELLPDRTARLPGRSAPMERNATQR